MARNGDARFNRVLVFCRQCPSKSSSSLLPLSSSSTPAAFVSTGGTVTTTTNVPSAAFSSSSSSSSSCISAFDEHTRCLTLQRDNHPPRTYSFDGVYGPTVSQTDVFTTIALPAINDVLIGFNATVMAYGQTGTGKTYTMTGPELAGIMDNSSSSISNTNTNANDIDTNVINGNVLSADTAGILPRSVLTVFQKISIDSNHDYSVQIAFVQIYCEAIYDLLSSPESCTSSNGSSGLPIREDPDTGIYIDGTTWVSVNDAEQCLRVVAIGSKNRAVASTLLNAHSSRSHAIFMMRVEKKTKQPSLLSSSVSSSTIPETIVPTRIQRGTLFLVDLAGSERVSKSGVTGIHLDETRAINLSLTSLGNVIAALAARGDAYNKRTGSSNSSTSVSQTGSGNLKGQIMRQIHVPYRDSKLTRLLQDSLGGNARTSLIVTFSPSAQSAMETQSTLEFGARASRVAVHAIRNETVDYRSLYLALRKQMEVVSNPNPSNDSGANTNEQNHTNNRYLLEDPETDKRIQQLQETVQSLTQEIRELRTNQHSNHPSFINSTSGNTTISSNGENSTIVNRTGTAVVSTTNTLPLPSSLPTGTVVTLNDKQFTEYTKLKGNYNLLQQDYDRSQDELLIAMTEQRKLKERLREVERNSTARISSLLEELEDVRNQLDESTKRADAAETEGENLRARLRDVMKHNIDHSNINGTRSSLDEANLPTEAMEAVAEVTRLYEDTLARMTKRVLNLEARASTTDTVLHEVASRLRVKERHSAALSQLLYDNELLNDNNVNSSPNDEGSTNNEEYVPNENTNIVPFLPPGKIRPTGMTNIMQRPMSEGAVPRQTYPLNTVNQGTSTNIRSQPINVTTVTPIFPTPPTTKSIRGIGPTIQYNSNVTRPSTSMGIHAGTNSNAMIGLSLSSSALSASLASANAAALGLPRAVQPRIIVNNTNNTNNGTLSNGLKMNVTGLRKG